MIVGLLALVFYQGLSTFWPVPLVQIKTIEGAIYLGEVTRVETYHPDPSAIAKLRGESLREQVQGLLTGTAGCPRAAPPHRQFRPGSHPLPWVSDFEVAEETRPEWGLVVERATNDGRFYGFPKAFLVEGQAATTESADVVAKYNEYRAASENESCKVTLTTADGKEKTLALNEIVRLYPANQLGFAGRLSIYRRWWEFLERNPQTPTVKAASFRPFGAPRP